MKNLMTIMGLVSLLLTSLAHSAEQEDNAKSSLFHETFLGNLKAANDKIIQLADEFSDEQYAWRPAEGIRSVGESMTHVAAANYFLGSMLGKEVPEGINPRAFEKTVVEKDEILATLKASIIFAREAIEGVSEEDLETTIKLFGKESPKLRAVLIIGAHANEHLGQLIAYARSIGVAPPWSK
ncbi:DinB family protein [Puniceicoccaceae bacterium K14]|nr:DinB family protein [Puniceicoccaceae bacterium K14]